MNKISRTNYVQYLMVSLGLSLCFQAFSASNSNPQPPASQQAIITTSMGIIEIELYVDQAPVSVTNFIRYIQAGAFESGSFYRVVRLDNDNGSPKIEVIQGGASPEFNDFSAIPLETTQQTGIRHLDGVLSMARAAPNTATSEFFICIGAQPALDFSGLRNPDGQGFAAFGRVTRGMETVRKIHQIRQARSVDDSYLEGQLLADPIRISSIELIKTDRLQPN